MSTKGANWIDDIVFEALPDGLGGGDVVLDDLPSVSTLTGRSLDLLRNAAGQSQGRLDDWLFGPHRTMQASMTDAMLLVGMGLMRRQPGRLSGQAKFYITDAGREVLAEAERPVKEAEEPFSRGDHIEIISGPYVGQSAQVFWKEGDRWVVSVGTLGYRDLGTEQMRLIKRYQAVAGAERPAKEGWNDPWTASPAEVEGLISSRIVEFQGLSGVPTTMELAQSAPQVVILTTHSGNTYDVAFAGGQFTFTPRDIVHDPTWGPGGPIMLARRQVRAASQMTARQFHDRFVDPITLSYSDVLTWMTANGINPNALQDEDYWYEIFKDFSPEKAPPDPDYASRRPAMLARRSVQETSYPQEGRVLDDAVRLLGNARNHLDSVIKTGPDALDRPLSDIDINLASAEQLLYVAAHDLKRGGWEEAKRPARKPRSTVVRRPVAEADYSAEADVLERIVVRDIKNARAKVNSVINSVPGVLYQTLSEADTKMAGAEQALMGHANSLRQPGWESARPVEEGSYRERRLRRLRASIPTLHDRVKWVLSSTTKPGLTADLVGAALEMSTAEAAEVLAALVQKGEVEELAAGVFRMKAAVKRSREADQAGFAEWRYQRGEGHNPGLVDSFETWVALNSTFGASYRTRLDEWDSLFEEWQMGDGVSWEARRRPARPSKVAGRVRMREARGMVKAGTKSWFVSGEWDVAEFIQDTPVTVEGPDASGWYTTVGDIPGFPPGKRVFLRREHFRTLTASSRVPAREAEQVNFVTFVDQSPLSAQETDVFWDWLGTYEGIEDKNVTLSLDEWSDLLTKFGESEYGGGSYGARRPVRQRANRATNAKGA